MNFKKLKRLLSVALSVSMVLSSNMAGFAAELAAPEQVESVAEQGDHEHDWQLQTVTKEATADEMGMGTYVCECGETKLAAIEQITPAADDGAAGDTQTPSEEPDTSTEPGVAKIGDTEYATLDEALKTVAANETITLLNDAVLNGAATYNLADKTVDTAGYTITVADGAKIRLQGGSFVNTVLAETNSPDDANGSYGPGAKSRTILSVQEGARLVIEGGTYTTKGVQMLRIAGDVTINGGSFSCNAELSEIGGNRIFYNGAVLFSVLGDQGKLTMTEGTVDVSGIGTDADGRMYAIYAFNNGTVVLGQQESKAADGTVIPAKGPIVKGGYAAVGLNTSVPSAALTIHEGTYTNAMVTADDEAFNTVLALFAQCTLTINGGTFTANSMGTANHAITFTGEANQTVAINGGTFSSAGDVFCQANAIGKVVKGGTFSSDPTAYLADGYGVKADTTYEVEATCTHKNESNTTTITAVSATDPTCFKEGTVFHYECTKCHKMFALPDGSIELTDEQVKTVDKKNHDGRWVEPVPATCAHPGYRGYYECKNCHRCYETMSELKKDNGDEANNKDKKDFVIAAEDVPHTYEAAGYAFTWGTLTADEGASDVTTFDTFQELQQAVNAITTEDAVTVTRTCSICENEEETTYPGTVTVSAPETLSYNCAEGITVTLTATAVDPAEPEAPQVEEGSEETGITDTYTLKVLPVAHNYTYTATPKTSAPDSRAVVNGSDLFTMTRQCQVTGCEKAAAAEEATGIRLLVNGIDLENGCETETVTNVTVEGTFADGNTGEVTGQTVQLTGDGHNWSYIPYKAATCTEDGVYAHYECDKCGGIFWSPQNSGASDRLTEDQVKINKISHNFGVPEFDWENATQTKAKATFTCIKCHAAITRGNLTAVEDETFDETKYTCTETMAVPYNVTVKFDKSYVVTEENDAFGDPIYEYQEPTDPAASIEADYPGEITKNVVKGHNFTASVAWNDTKSDGPDSPAYHDIAADGVVVTLTCQNCVDANGTECGTTITLPATFKALTEGGDPETVTGTIGGSVTGATGTVTITKNEDRPDGFVEALCTSDGKDVYDVVAKCTSDDGKGEQTYNATDAEEPLRVSTATPALGHKFKITDALNEDGTYKNVYWENPYAANYPDTADDVTVTLVCENNEKHQVTLTGPDEGVTLTEATDPETTPYVARTCTTDGTNAWAVSVAYDGKVFTKFNELGTAALPAEEPGQTEPDNTIYLTKTKPAAGHDYGEGVFDWSSYDTTKKVYYVYTCQSNECVGEEGELEGTNVITTQNPETYDTKDGKTVRKFEATLATTTTRPPTCTTDGAGTTTATVVLNGETKEDKDTSGVIPATGHTWDNSTIEWGAWTKVEGAAPVTVTVNGEECQVPDYQITVTRQCTNRDETETVTNKLSEMASLDAATATDSFIKITVTDHQDVSCMEDGTTTYAAEFYGKTNSKDERPVKVDGAAPEDGTDTVTHGGHHFRTEVTVDWDNMAEEQLLKNGEPVMSANGREIYTGKFLVDASRKCADCNETEEVPVSVTVTGKCGDTAAEDQPNVIFTAVVDDDYAPADGTTKDELTFAAVGDAGETCETYGKSYAAHQLTRIEGQTGNCGQISFITHYHCALCGKSFRNSNATTQADVSFEEQKHVYGEPDFRWNVEGTSASASFKCLNCDDVNAVLAYSAEIGDAVPDREPTCQTPGTKYYSVWVRFTQDNLPEQFTMPDGADELRFDGELGVSVPVVDHQFTKQTADGLVCKWCGKKKDNMVKVSYVMDNGTSIRDSEWFAKDDGTLTADKINPPAAPNQSTRILDYWTVNDERLTDGQTLADAVLAAVKKAGVTEVTVKAVYKDITATANVIVAYIGIEKAPDAAVSVDVGSRKTVTAAAEATGKYFSHWSSDDAGETVLSRNASYDVYAPSADDITVYAVYVDAEPEEEVIPTIAITNIFTTNIDNVHKVCFTATMDIPENFEMVESGLLYGGNLAAGTKLTLEGVEGGTGRKSMLNGAKTNTLSIKVSSDTLKVSARGYLRYRDTVTKREIVIYSQMVTKSYTDLTAN